MKRSLWLRRTAALAAVALIATACGGGDDEETAEPTETEAPTATEEETSPAEEETTPEEEETDEEVAAAENVDDVLTVGTVLPQTGDLAALGPAMSEAVDLAIQEINEAGGVLGQDVVLIEGDSGTNESVASSTVDQHLRDGVDAIIGAASSRISLSIIDKVTGNELVQCSPSNTGAAFTDYEDSDPGFYFRTAPPDNLQGPALADVITGDGFSNVGIIALNDEYGQGFADFLATALEESGATVAANVAYDPAGTEFSADVTQLADANPDAVAVIGFPDTGSRILSEMISQGIGPDSIGVYTADGMQDDTLGDAVDPENPSAIEGLKGTAPSSQGSEAFTQAFEEFAPEDTPQIFSAHAYDCMNLIAMAAAQAGTDDPTVFNAEIVPATQEGEECTDFASCSALIEEGSDFNYNGASGGLNFTPPGEPGAGTYEIWELTYTDGEGSIETLDTTTVEGSEG